MKQGSFVRLSWLLVACAAGCDGDPEAPDGGAGGRAATRTASTTAAEVSSSTGTGGEDATIFGACDGVAPGEAGADSTFVGLSRAHASLRFFGDHGDVVATDAALVAALEAGGEDERAILSAYVTEVAQGCAMPAAIGSIPAARVDRVGDVAWIRFGAGDVVVPTDAKAIVIDLADAVEGPTLDGFLARAASAALTTDVEGLTAHVRVHEGMRDEAYAPFFLGFENQYDDRMRTEPLPPIAGGATAARPIGVRLGERAAPSAARFAATLRARGRASLIEHGTTAALAESRWVPVRTYGFVHRVTTLRAGAADLPDALPADVTGDGEAALGAALLAAPEPPALGGAATRVRLAALPNGDELPPEDYGLATRRAALIVAHGAMKGFFAYWSVVPDASDARLDGALARAATDPDELRSLYDELGFLSYALHDSHGFVFPLGQTLLGGAHVGLFLEGSDTGEPVVRLSQVPGVDVGDTIVAVDGTPAATVMAERGERVASSDSSRFRNEAETLLAGPLPATFTLRAPDGLERDVEIPASSSVQGYPVFPVRARGFMTDLGAPSLYYVDLDSEAFLQTDLDDAIAAIDTSDGVVLDLRGYPNAPAWSLLQHLLVEGAPGVQMRIERISAFARTWVPSPQPWPVETGGFAGKVVVLVSPHTQSQAEHLALTLQSAGRVHVIGHPSAGANGNITGVLLPGAMGLTFTGMEVRQADLSRFHGVGVLPDEIVPITPAALAAGDDPELLAAIDYLLAP